MNFQVSVNDLKLELGNGQWACVTWFFPCPLFIALIFGLFPVTDTQSCVGKQTQVWCFNLLELLFSTSRTCESWPNAQKIRVKVTFTDLLLPPQKHFGTLTLPNYYSNVKLFTFFNSVSSCSSCGGRMVPNLIILLVLQSLCMGKFYLLKTGKFNYIINY